MIKVSLPGRDEILELKYMGLDLNGTICTDGKLIDGVKERLEILKNELEVYLLTADTMGSGSQIAEELGIQMFKVDGENGADDKLDFINTIGKENTVAIGNGYNDRLMFDNSALSIVIIGQEGCCVQALNRADIAVNNIRDAFDLLIKPVRIIATLRG